MQLKRGPRPSSQLNGGPSRLPQTRRKPQNEWRTYVPLLTTLPASLCPVRRPVADLAHRGRQAEGNPARLGDLPSGLDGAQGGGPAGATHTQETDRDQL